MFPVHRQIVVPWRTRSRGPKADRMLTEITTSVPPLIAEVDLPLSKASELAVVEATAAIAALDAGPGHHLAGLGSFLLRTESVASSRIERVNARQVDVAKAAVGLRTSDDGRQTWAAMTAISQMIDLAGRQGQVEEADVLAAHRLLMGEDWSEKEHAGRWREVQNWIGGSDHSPRGAVHVPPAPELVPELVQDLFRYAERTDIPALVQAAVVHAQFESIHPFTDGNGRIGRGLISAIIRRRELATTAVIPIASALLADTSAYFAVLNGYRSGAADELVEHLALASLSAVAAARSTAEILAELPTVWADRARPRRGSTDETLVGLLLGNPVVDVAAVCDLTGASYNAAAAACGRLEEAGVLVPVTARARDRAWMAVEVLDEIDELNRRIGPRSAP